MNEGNSQKVPNCKTQETGHEKKERTGRAKSCFYRLSCYNWVKCSQKQHSYFYAPAFSQVIHRNSNDILGKLIECKLRNATSIFLPHCVRKKERKKGTGCDMCNPKRCIFAQRVLRHFLTKGYYLERSHNKAIHRTASEHLCQKQAKHLQSIEDETE